MDLSVVILNYNTRGILSQCLHKAEKALQNLQAEIIVVDNASTDGSRVMVKEKFPNVKLVELEENIGFSAGNNVGAAEASGKYLCFLNSDVLVNQDTFIKLFDYLEKDDKAGVVTPKLVLRNNQLDPDCHRGFPTPWAALSYFSGLEKMFPKSRIFGQYHQLYKNLDQTHQIDACCGAFLMVRRKLGEKIGWWDEQYFFYGEDLDFCYQVKEQGWSVVYFPLAEAVHYKGASSGLRKETKDLKVERKTRIKAAQESVRAMEIFYNKFYQEKYPLLVTKVVLLGIRVKGYLRILFNYLKK
jgi:hypothetical protein